MELPDRVIRSSVGRCPECGKFSYQSRSDAKRAAKINHPGERLTAYLCRHPDGLGWHYGHNTIWRHRDNDT